MTWYTGDPTYDTTLAIALMAIVPIALGSMFVIAPYGRFTSDKLGATLDPRLGWCLMELPATISFVAVYAVSSNSFDPVPLFFLCVWLIHYGNRGFIGPALMRVPSGKRQSFSISVVISGWLVTSAHGYLNAAYLAEHGGYDTSWFTDPRFLIGIAVYFGALAGNIHADAVLRNLRSREEVRQGNAPYRVPHGGLYRLVTCPNYFYELIAWVGFATATWSLGSLFVLGVSAANLVPRALATHKWYHEKFDDYPSGRRALIPYVL